MSDDIVLTVELTSEHIRQLATSVEFHYEKWPGYPAAPKEEQERLWELRLMLRCALMECAYHRDNPQASD